jgi:hypothetical protein
MIAMEQYYGSPFEKWARGFCFRNQWRVTHILGNDIEDFYSQCSIWWVECYEFYKGSVDSDPLLMNMFKLWVTGQTHDMSRKDTNYRKVIADPIAEDPTVILANTAGTCLNYDGKSIHGRFSNLYEPIVYAETELNLKLDSASNELKEVLKIFTSAPLEIMEVLRADCQSPCPKQFFKRVITYLKIDGKRAPELAKELQSLLS